MYARERLEHAAQWYGWNNENLNSRLRSTYDALRLYDYAQAHPDLPEMADAWEPEQRIAALGYDPFDEPCDHEPQDCGAAAVDAVLREAYALLDSVAFVAQAGDTDALKARMQEVLGLAAKEQPLASQAPSMG